MRKGLSLLEMLVVIAIVSGLIILAITQHGVFLTKTKTEVISSRLLRAMNVARSQSALLGMPITVCPSKDQMTCGGQWNDGQIVFIDQNGSGSVNGKERVLYRFGSAKDKGHLYWRSALRKNYLLFMPTGLSPSEDGTFWYCSGEKKLIWAIIVNQAERARIIYPDFNNRIDSVSC